jgi:hypothetical protein
MDDGKASEKRLRRACKNLGFVLNRSKVTGAYAVMGADGAAVTGDDTLTLGEIKDWLAGIGTRMRHDITTGVVEDRGRYELHIGDAETALRRLPAEAFQTCITSPPYFQHRNYSVEGQIGQEKTPDGLFLNGQKNTNIPLHGHED